MGREVRRVPANWEHPKNGQGYLAPLYGDSFAKRLAEWEEGHAKWAEGFRDDWNGGWAPKGTDLEGMTYEDWSGSRPQEEDYMPDWPEAERTHWQMYETCTEGTPISPVMASPDELADWLHDNSASAFGGMTATRDQWLGTIMRGSSISAVYDGTVSGLRSGVEAGV